MVGVLAVLARLRHLIFQVMTANVRRRRRVPDAGYTCRASPPTCSGFRRGTAATGRGSCCAYSAFRDHDRVADRLVGAVPPAGADGRHPRCAQTGSLPMPDGASARSRIGPVPVRLDKVRFRYPERRPRRAARGQPGTSGRRACRGHRRQRFREDHVDADPGRPGTDVGQRATRPAQWVWASSAARRLSCSTRRARCWAPGSPTTWCGVCRRAPQIDVDRSAERGRPGGSRRARHRKPVRRGTATPRACRGAGPRAGAADRRRGHHA